MFSQVVSTVYDSPDLPSCRRYQKAPLGASSGNHTKASRGRASRGHFELVWNSTSSAGTPSTRLRPMALSTGRVRFCTRACSSTASQARVREGGLRLTTVTGGPSTTGTQNLSSTCPRGPVDLRNSALSRKLKLKQPKRCVLSLVHFPLLSVSVEKMEGICGC